MGCWETVGGEGGQGARAAADVIWRLLSARIPCRPPAPAPLDGPLNFSGSPSCTALLQVLVAFTVNDDLFTFNHVEGVEL